MKHAVASGIDMRATRRNTLEQQQQQQQQRLPSSERVSFSHSRPTISSESISNGEFPIVE
jgi:transcription initiation factor TFIID subunit TAF12